MAKIIGIVASGVFDSPDEKVLDHCKFNANYSQQIALAGGIPMGLLPVDGRIPEQALAMCDGFLICGGTASWPYQLQTACYAITHHKPLMGICLGCQTIHRAFNLLDEMERTGEQTDGWELFCRLRDAGDPRVVLGKVEGHFHPFVKGKFHEIRHTVYLTPGSRAAALMGTDRLEGCTSHNYCAQQVSPRLTVSGRTEDGTVEVLEYEDWVLGTQFHPELEGRLPQLFEWLCK